MNRIFYVYLNSDKLKLTDKIISDMFTGGKEIQEIAAQLLTLKRFYE